MANNTLPEGFTWGDAPQKSELPEGFTWADEPRTQRSFGEKLKESITSPSPEVIPNPSSLIGLARAGYQGLQAAKGMIEGTRPYIPGGPGRESLVEDIAGLGSLVTPGNPAAGSGATIARLAGVGIPSRGPAAVAEATAMGTRAPLIPTGRMVTPEEAGAPIAQRVQASPLPVRGLSGAENNEATFNRLLTLATSRNNDDIAVIHRMRASVPKEDWAKVQSSAIEQLGQGVEGNFDPQAWVSNYSGLSKAGKKALFPDDELTRHLDAIADVSTRARDWTNRSQVSKIASTLFPNMLSMVTRPVRTVLHPVASLAALAGGRLISSALSRPSGAASVAAWTRAYEGLIRRPGSATLGSFNMASKNLNNNLGTDFSTEDFLNAIDVKLELPGQNKSDFLEALTHPSGGTVVPARDESPTAPTPPDERDLTRYRARAPLLGGF